MLVTGLGLQALDQYSLWIVYALYALGAFWLAWRRQAVQFTWIGSALLSAALALNFAPPGFAFPWQTAFFAHAPICAAAAIISSRNERSNIFSVLNYSALISIVLGVVCLFQANTWTITWMQAQRVFWIAGILLLLLWLNRRRLIFNLFQVALICALVLTVKAVLQGFDWYSYVPHAFLRPAALQIQGTVLTLFCLTWIALRRAFLECGDQAPLWSRSDANDNKAAPGRRTPRRHAIESASLLLGSRFAVDRFLVWLLIPAFLLLAIYGSLS